MTSASLDCVGLQARLQPDRLAVLELQSGRRWTYAQLDRAIAQCARYKIPKHVTVLAGLPRTGSGKLRKNELRALLASHSARLSS